MAQNGREGRVKALAFQLDRRAIAELERDCRRARSGAEVRQCAAALAGAGLWGRRAVRITDRSFGRIEVLRQRRSRRRW